MDDLHLRRVAHGQRPRARAEAVQPLFLLARAAFLELAGGLEHELLMADLLHAVFDSADIERESARGR